MTHSIEAEGLRKRYGEKIALDSLDLAVRPGTVCGLLGPNGAGKTTVVRILATLLRFDSGRARVAGRDVRHDGREVRRQIGLTGQNMAIDDILTARQNLEMFGRLFHISATRARRRAGELLERFGLADVADQQPKRFSGGMRRRLDLAASMILAPEVLFLDEPTTGLDPQGRREVWEAVRGLAAGGTTVLLTTHYLDEADRLSDQIVVIDHGRSVVDDTPEGVKRAIGGDRLEVVAKEPSDLQKIGTVVAAVAEPILDEQTLRVHAPVTDRIEALTTVAQALRREQVEVEDLTVRRPTLDDAFLALTDERTEGAA